MRHKSGFTIVELLIIILLIAIIATFAIPNIIVIMPSFRLKAAAHDLFSNFQKAKLTAVKSNANCAVRFTPNGYVVFEDDGNFTQEVTDRQIVSVNWSNYPDVSIISANITFFDNSAGEPTIAFRSNGIPVDAGGGVAGGTAPLINRNGRTASVIVSQAGSIRIK